MKEGKIEREENLYSIFVYAKKPNNFPGIIRVWSFKSREFI
jgi:hypothetical protein